MQVVLGLRRFLRRAESSQKGQHGALIRLSLNCLSILECVPISHHSTIIENLKTEKSKKISASTIFRENPQFGRDRTAESRTICTPAV